MNLYLKQSLLKAAALTAGVALLAAIPMLLKHPFAHTAALTLCVLLLSVERDEGRGRIDFSCVLEWRSAIALYAAMSAPAVYYSDLLPMSWAVSYVAIALGVAASLLYLQMHAIRISEIQDRVVWYHAWEINHDTSVGLALTFLIAIILFDIRMGL